MSKRTLLLLASITAILVLIPLFKCNKALSKQSQIDPAFSAYISGFTSGIVSTDASIKIVLTSDINKPVEIGKPIEEKLFDLSPDVKGTATWLDARTIEFKPEQKLTSGQFYKVEFYLSKVLDVPAEFKTFDFSFEVIKQTFEVYVDGITTIDKQTLRWQQAKGLLSTSDGAASDMIEKLLTAEQNGKDLNIHWTHENNLSHRFVVDSILRTDAPSKVIIKWDGKALGINTNGSTELEIPALGDFKVMDVKVVQEADQYISVQFSDPVQEKQNLAGLVTLSDVATNLKFITEDNEIRVYPSEHLSGAKVINVETGVKNILGNPLKSKYSMQVLFEDIKPAVRLTGKGVIIPNSNGLIFPFEAVNLNAVDVKIIKIYENNILQFLQVNSIDGNGELTRVGKTVFKKTIPLSSKSAADRGRWNTYSLDLSELIKTEPGAIYKVKLSFKKAYSTYNCTGEAAGDNTNNVEEIAQDDNEDEDGYNGNGYSYYYEDDYYYPEDYSYKERENPCNVSYYTSQKNVSRSVLASDLGIIAKIGADGAVVFAVSDLKTTKPIAGTELELYDYQRQLVGKTVTDGEGLAKIDIKKRPFVLIAKKDNQRGYLKLDDGSSLSLSMFDVSGKSVQKGIKGFIYGERGVWRPGDTLFLSFILEDKLNTLPKNHPVSFELSNPRGQLVKKLVKNDPLNGFYNFTVVTDKDAPTGDWSATVKVGGVTFSKNIKIETIMPNRLKLNLDFGLTQLNAKSKDQKGKLHAAWLTGAVAHNLPTKVEVNLWEGRTVFKGFEEYNFSDPARQFTAETQTLFDSNLDNDGNAIVSPEVNMTNAAPGMLNASFTVRVFEEGGGFSVDRFTLPYSPYNTYVGIKAPEGKNKYDNTLTTNKDHVIQIATLSGEGKPVSREKVTVEIYKLDWRWWWDSYDGELANYVGNTYHQPYKKQVISTVNGKGQFIFKVNEAEWGRYLIHVSDEDGHASGKVIYFDWPSWAEKDMAGTNQSASLLSFTADKDKYAVGENVKLTIPSGSEGRALVSIETGSKVLKAYWVETQKGRTECSFQVTPEMAPNIYVNVTLVQPHAQSKNDLPIRLYGILPVLVEDPNTHLRPVVKTADVWKPEEKASITVSEENGKDMTYTIAVVDEGLLDLTRFKTPDPWSDFYAREALGVRTWDLYDMVMGAYGGELERILAIGGDGGIDKDAAQKANRFKPMVKFMGPFYLKKGERRTHEFMMPQYIGSVRTMVVAGQNFAYGSSDKTTPVRKPLMILGTLPRVVGPGETVDLPVTVFAMEKQVKNVSIDVTSNNMFTVEGGNNRSATFPQIGDQVINFKLKVKDALGIAKVTIHAKSGNEKADYTIELDVRNQNPKVTNVLETTIEPGKSWNSNYTPVGMVGTNKGTLELSTLPPVNMAKRLRYLVEYPHGCIEQTTSAVFPQLFLTDVMELTSDYKAVIDRNIKSGLQRLRSFQAPGGGLSYWPGGNEADEWGSNYAGHFMIEAEQKGYTLPIGLIDNWKRYQKSKALSWNPPKANDKNGYYYFYNYDLDQAYRLYTLALAKAPELGAMNRLKEFKGLSIAAKWRLAAAYLLAGQPEVAKNLIAGLSTAVTPYAQMGYTYGSDERDEAMILETLTLMNEKIKAASVVKDLSKALSSDMWMSTQTTAYGLIAVSKFAKMGGGASSELRCGYTINGTQSILASKLPISQLDMKMSGNKAGSVTVNNTGKGILFARVIMEGIPLTGDQTQAENNLKLNISYTTINDKDIDVSRLEQGTDFIATVSITNPGIKGEYKQMALTQIFPSGWEIHNVRMDEAESTVKTDIPTYQDIRDDKVYTYFDIPANTTMKFRIILNASYTGKFYLPTVACEAMYDNTISARKPGKWVEVVKPGEKL
jgi:uncharacterized protein YfaS (alpha-2-macroglobulin family)